MQEAAATALCNLAQGPQCNKDAVVAAGAVLLLVSLLLKSDQPCVQRPTTGALQRLAWDSQQKKQGRQHGSWPYAICIRTCLFCKLS